LRPNPFKVSTMLRAHFFTRWKVDRFFWKRSTEESLAGRRATRALVRRRRPAARWDPGEPTTTSFFQTMADCGTCRAMAGNPSCWSRQMLRLLGLISSLTGMRSSLQPWVPSDSYDVTSDCQRFLFGVTPGTLDSRPINVVVNWAATLKK